MRMVAFAALALVAAAVLLELLVITLEPRMAFFPLRGEGRTPRDFGLPYASRDVRTSDGETIRVWHLPHERPLGRVLYWHGNGGNLSLWLDVLVVLHARGFDVTALDYRGYGVSTGTPDEQGLYRDTAAFVRDAQSATNTGDVPLIYWGRSLGGPYAAYATTLVPPDGMVLEATFPSLSALLATNSVLRLFAPFASYTFPTVSFLREFRRPTLVLHGDADRVIPYRLGRQLHDALPGPKRFVTLRGVDHNDVLTEAEEGYWGPITRWVADLR